MANVFSPQVVTKEQDISTIAPNVSTSIAAIVGGAVKGPVNEPQFITSPDQFVEVFGEPTPLSYLGYAAINFLRQGNQLWVNRIASTDGSDPVATATTDTQPFVVSNQPFNFGVTGSLDISIDSTPVTINFSPVTSATLNDIVATINSALSATSPRLGYAEIDGSNIIIYGQSRDSRISSVVISNVTNIGGFTAGQQSYSERVIQTSQALNPASILSVNSAPTFNTSVTYANIVGNSSTQGTLYNVSKLSQEAYGTLTIENASFTAGTYNQLVVRAGATQPSAGETLTVGSLVLTVGTDVPTPAGWTASDKDTFVSSIVDAINNTVSITAQVPSAGARAAITDTAVSGANAEFTLTQIDANTATIVTATYSVAGVLVDDGGNDLNAGLQLSGGTQGSYIKIVVPATWNDSGTVNEENDITYWFQAGADWSLPTDNSLTTIAANIASAITNFGGYFISKEYALKATSSGNVVTITTNPIGEGGSTGNNITVDVTNLPSGSVTTDLNAGALYHGFDSRPTYSFATLVIDGVSKTVNFDTQVPTSIISNPHEATAQQIADGINYVFGQNLASVIIPTSGQEAIQVSSPIPGVEGTATATVSQNIGANNDPFATVTPTAGSGDNHLVVRIDDKWDVEVYLSQSTTQSMNQIAADINSAAATVDPSLSSIATVENDKVRITSPTPGSWADFGSRVYVTNGISGLFPTNTFDNGSGNKLNTVTITATSPGTWANGVISVAFQDEDPVFYAPNSSRVDVLYNGVVVETFREVVVNPNADGSTGPSGQGTFIETAINGNSQYIQVDFDDNLLDLDPNTLATSVKFVPNTSALGSNPPYKLSGGADGLEGISSGDVIGTIDTIGNATGLQVFADPEKIFINLLAAPGFTDQAVADELVSIAESRQDTLAIIDPPYGLSAQDVVDWHNGQGHGRTSALNTSYAATYNTWLTQYDPYNNINIDLPPSAFILGKFAYNDSVAEPWFAAGGLSRGRITNALDVVSQSTLGERELMYGQGNRINPIPKFVQDGIVVWGNRTLYRQESALKEITVRRLLNYAKTVISLAARVVLFEPNDDTSVNKLIGLINPVLYDIKVKRGLSKFSVVDATTDADRNANRLVVKIFLQPSHTVEVIEIPFIITEQGGNFAL